MENAGDGDLNDKRSCASMGYVARKRPSPHAVRTFDDIRFGCPNRRTGGLFYLERTSDQITGPFVEVGTVLHHSPLLNTAANLWATVVFVVVIWGWIPNPAISPSSPGWAHCSDDTCVASGLAIHRSRPLSDSACTNDISGFNGRTR